MSELIGHDGHDCQRDELPRFMGARWHKYATGDVVECSCGRVWYVEDGSFCQYRRLKGRRLRKWLDTQTAGIALGQ